MRQFTAMLPHEPTTRRIGLVWELLINAWIIVVNLLYYSQFKTLVLRVLGRFNGR